MRVIIMILGYLKWHYGKALYSLIVIWKNFLGFTYEYFSIGLLFKNFFSPWKRMTDSYPKSFDLKKYFYAFITNLIVRVFGMIVRAFMIIVGLLAYIMMIILYPLVLICWLFLPLIIVYLIGTGLVLLIK